MNHLFIDTSNDGNWSTMLNCYVIPHGLGTIEEPVIPNRLMTEFICPISDQPHFMSCHKLASSADEINIYVCFDVVVRDQTGAYYVADSGINVAYDYVA